jgi:two-component system response regulator FixJ
METQTLFVIDENASTHARLDQQAQARGLPTKTFDSAEAFLAQLDASTAGCIVCEMRLPGMSGRELIAELRDRGNPLPVIVVTAHADVPSAVEIMQAGAMTLLQKPCPDDVLWPAIQTALERERTVRAAWRERREIDARLATLAPGEMQVMRALLAGKPNKRVAAELGIGLRTVELRRARLLKKMQAGSLAELVRMATISGVNPGAANENDEDDSPPN